jgi:hypothetical protein
MQQEDKGDWWEGIFHLLPLPSKWAWWWWWDGELQLNQTNWVACQFSCSLSGAPAAVSSPRAKPPPYTKGQIQRETCSDESPQSLLILLKKETKKCQLPDWSRPNSSASLNLRLLGNRSPQTDNTGRDSGASYPTAQRPPNFSVQVWNVEADVWYVLCITTMWMSGFGG